MGRVGSFARRTGARRCLEPAAHVATILLLIVAHVGPASASDGVLEINQACAAVGCFPGDAPGLPVQIQGAAGTAFRLTSNLTATGSAIVISTDEAVALDLNGFAIRGPGSCSGTLGSISCTGLAGAGIDVSAPLGQLQTRIRNGFVSGFGHAVRVISGSATGSLRISDLQIESSGNGILGSDSASADLIVERSVVRRTVGACISWRWDVDVRESQIMDCGGVGVSVPGRRVGIADSRIERVTLGGIDCGDFSTIRAVEVIAAGGTGIQCGRSCQIIGSKIVNGLGSGIATGYLASIVDNVVDSNGGTAIQASDGSKIRGNTVGAARVFDVYPGIQCDLG